MGANAQQFNNVNIANLQPGMVLSSGAMSTSGIYSLKTGNYAALSVPVGTAQVAGNFNFLITQLSTGRSIQSVVVQTPPFDSDNNFITMQLAQAFAPLYIVSFAGGTLTITAKTPGVAGNFTVVLPGGFFSSNAAVDPLAIQPGRIVVADSTVNWNAQSNFEINVVYPSTASTNTESLGGLYVTGFGSCFNVTPTPYQSIQDGSQVSAGNIVELYTQVDAFVMQSLSPLKSFDTIFVETSVANNGANTGKITATGSATAVQLTPGRLRVVQGTPTAGGLVIVQLV